MFKLGNIFFQWQNIVTSTPTESLQQILPTSYGIHVVTGKCVYACLQIKTEKSQPQESNDFRGTY